MGTMDEFNASIKRMDEDGTFRKALVLMRQNLRQLLADHGVKSNPGWSDNDIVGTIKDLLEKKSETLP